jgi:hypothetical protein
VCCDALLVGRPDEDTGDGEYMAALKDTPPGPPHCGTSRPWSCAIVRDAHQLRCCPALGYADAEDHVIGGSLLDTGCPNEEEPQETPLSVV